MISRRPSLSRAAVLSVALAAGVSLAACASDPQQPTASGDDENQVAATVNGETITVGELDAWIKQDLFRRELGGDSPANLYELRSEAIDQMIDQRLVEIKAQQLGVAPDALIESEVEALGPVTDREVTEFYKKNRDRIQGGGEIDEVAPRIRGYLEQQRPALVVGDIRRAASVKIELTRPRTPVEGAGPSRGPADAAVVIVEFSDYQCPYCRRAEPTLNKIVERYPKDVRWEYRHYPLPNHPAARPAAEAAVCAEAQGKFWPYHDLLFGQTGSLDADGLRRYAQEAGLDLAQFEACQQAPDTRARVEADLRAGEAAGARGTPAFFINGLFVNGARPFEEFDEMIQKELADSTNAAQGSGD